MTPGFLGGGLEIITSHPDTLATITTIVNFNSLLLLQLG